MESQASKPGTLGRFSMPPKTTPGESPEPCFGLARSGDLGIKRKPAETQCFSGIFLVGANGLEPLTPCTSSRCSSQLS